jgi:hypothetical protein
VNGHVARWKLASVTAVAFDGGEARVRSRIAAAAALALLLLLVPFRSLDDIDREWIVWGSVALLLVLPIAAYAGARRGGRNPWIDPVFLVTAFFGFKYGFGALAANYWSMLSWADMPGAAAIFERWGIWDNLPAACHLFALAGLGLFIGASLRPLRVFDTLPALRWAIDNRRFRMRLYVYTPVAMAVFVTGRRFLPMIIRDTVLLFGWISWVIIVVAAVQWLRQDIGDRRAWAGIVAIIAVGHVMLGFEIGMRGAFVYPLLLVAAGYAIARGHLPWGRVVIVGPVLLLLVIPWLTFYKFQSQDTPIMARVRGASDAMSEVDARGALDRGIEALVGRSVGVVGMTAVFIQDVPDLSPFEYGRTFLIQATHLVPRVLWPNKPNMSEQLNAYSRRAGLIDEEDDATTATFDAVSEYYVNFGMVGVFVLSLLHGCYLRALHRWLVERSVFIIGAPMFVVFILINFDFFGLFQTMLAHTRQIPVWAVVLYFLSRDTRVHA